MLKTKDDNKIKFLLYLILGFIAIFILILGIATSVQSNNNNTTNNLDNQEIFESSKGRRQHYNLCNESISGVWICKRGQKPGFAQFTETLFYKCLNSIEFRPKNENLCLRVMDAVINQNHSERDWILQDYYNAYTPNGIHIYSKTE